MEDYKYWAFVSYSHKDMVVATRLHRALENYRIPGILVGKTFSPGLTVPKRLYPSFRDRDELPTSADLGGNLRACIEASRTLIVICSRASARSRWVNEEILTFKRLGRSNRILCLIVDGEPNTSDIPGREEEECFPPAIRYALGPDGELTSDRVEPIAADYRPSGDGPHNSLLKLVAGICGVPFDGLKQRDRTRRRRQRTGVVLAVVLLATGILGWTEYLKQRHEAAERLQKAAHFYEQGRQKFLANDIENADRDFHLAFEAGSREPALRFGLAATSGYMKLRSAVLPRNPRPVPIVGSSGRADRFITAGADGSVKVWELSSAKPLFSTDSLSDSASSYGELSDDGSYLAVLINGRVAVWNIAERKKIYSSPVNAEWTNELKYLSASNKLILQGHRGLLSVVDLNSGNTIEIEKRRRAIEALGYSKTTGRFAFAARDEGISLQPLDSPTPLCTTGPVGAKVAELLFAPEGTLLFALLEGGTEVRVFDQQCQMAQTISRGSSKPRVRDIFFVGSGSELFALDEQGEIERWNVISGKLLGSSKLELSGYFTDAYFSPDFRYLALGDQRNFRICNTETAACKGDINIAPDKAGSAAFSSDNSIFITSSENGDVRLWNLSQLNPEVSCSISANRASSLSTVSFSANGKVALVGGGELAFSPAEVWDIEHCKRLREFDGNMAQFDSKGERVLTGSRTGTIRVASLAEDLQDSFTVGGGFGGMSILYSAWSPSGRYVAAGNSTGALTVYDTTSHSKTMELTVDGAGETSAAPSRSGIQSVLFSPDEKYLLALYSDKSGDLWELASKMSALKVFNLGEGSGKRSAFAPGGNRFAVGSQDGRIAVFAGLKAEPEAILPVDGRVTELRILKDGDRILATTDRGQITLWSVSKRMPIWQADSAEPSPALATLSNLPFSAAASLLKQESIHAAHCLDLNTDETFVAVGTEDGFDPPSELDQWKDHLGEGELWDSGGKRLQILTRRKDIGGSLRQRSEILAFA